MGPCFCTSCWMWHLSLLMGEISTSVALQPSKLLWTFVIQDRNTEHTSREGSHLLSDLSWILGPPWGGVYFFLIIFPPFFFPLLLFTLYSFLSFSLSPVLLAASPFTVTAIKKRVFPAQHSRGASRAWSTTDFFFLLFICMCDCSERWKFQWNGMLAKSMH